MAAFVIDASATLPWCFADEAAEATNAVLTHLRTGVHREGLEKPQLQKAGVALPSPQRGDAQASSALSSSGRVSGAHGQDGRGTRQTGATAFSLDNVGFIV